MRDTAKSTLFFTLTLALRATGLMSTTAGDGPVLSAFAEMRARTLSGEFRLFTIFRFQYHCAHTCEKLLVGPFVLLGVRAIARFAARGLGQFLAAARAL